MSTDRRNPPMPAHHMRQATATVVQDALALIDDLMRHQEAGLAETGWTGGVKWRADLWAQLVKRRDALAVALDVTHNEPEEGTR